MREREHLRIVPPKKYDHTTGLIHGPKSLIEVESRTPKEKVVHHDDITVGIPENTMINVQIWKSYRLEPQIWELPHHLHHIWALIRATHVQNVQWFLRNVPDDATTIPVVTMLSIPT